MNPRVLVADSHPLLREGLVAAVSSASDLDIVGSAFDGPGVLEAVRSLRVDVVVLDLALPPAGGVEICADLKEHHEGVRVVVMSELAESEVLLAAVEAGADGYVSRMMELDDLLSAIRRVFVGEAAIPPGMLSVLLRRLIQRRRDEDGVLDRFGRLSRREREVFALVIDGLDNQAISESLVVSPHTARTHIQNVLEKLEVHSRLEAVALAMEHNLMERFGARI
jgi:DNA-binding NarL/FixJ family response regulator